MTIYECESCKKEVHEKYGSGRFCSIKCAKGFSTKEKRLEINAKVSKTLTNRGNKPVDKICKTCSTKFTVCWKKRNRIFCSHKCLRFSEHTTNIISTKLKKRYSILENRIKLRDAGRRGGFGKKGYTEKGTYYASNLEKECFEYLEKLDIAFEAHKPLPGTSKVSDIYLISSNVWIELDGINRELRKKWLGKNYDYWIAKLSLYSELSLPLVIIKSFNEFKEYLAA